MTATATCPVCGRAVDPLRARAVGVKDGKVVAYDSVECQQKAEGKPRVVEDRDLDVRVTVRTPSKGVAVVVAPSAPITAADSGPVIEIIREASQATEAAPPRKDPTPVPRRDPTPVPRRDPTPLPVAKADTTTDAPTKPKSKRLDTDTRSLQPPDDYDDSDLGPPHEDGAPSPRRIPVLAILLFVVLAAAAAAVAFGLN